VSGTLAGWTPALERSFKELLYRFLEEVQATKAALYLLADDGAYILVTQYGFGRRDLLAAEHSPGEPMARLVRELRSSPRCFNSPAEIPEMLQYLEGAGTARLLVTPLFAASRILGFVDVRDKGRRQEFSPADIETAASIASAMVAALGEAHLYAELEDEMTPRVSHPAPANDVTLVGRHGATGLDAEALSAVLASAAHHAGCPDVRAVAVTQREDPVCETVVFSSGDLQEREVAALRRHQAEELRRHGHTAPPAEEWDIIVRQLDSNFASGASSIATVGVSSGLEVPLVLTVVGDKPESARRHLNGLQHVVGEATRACEARYCRRRMVLKLLGSRREENNPLRRHGEQVSRLSWAMAQTIGLSSSETEEVALAGLVHDIGLPEVLGRAPYANPNPGPEERQMYRRHVQAGERQLLGLGLKSLAFIVRRHHERWDGSGYPDRLSGGAIPLAARIIHAAEVYDVLTSRSSYRRTVSPGRALAMIKAAAGSQFDPKVVSALEKVLQ